MESTLVDFLSNTTVFKGVNKKVVSKIAASLNHVHIKRGETLFKEGDPSHSLYFILSGRIRLYQIQFNQEQHVINECSRGEVIGDIAVVIDTPRILTAKAVTDCELLELDKKTYQEFTDKYPKELLALTQNTVRNLYKSTLHRSEKKPQSQIFCIIPAATNPDFASHVRSIVTALNKIGPTLHLNRKKFETLFHLECCKENLEKISGSTLLKWRCKAEETYQFIVLETETTISGWTYWCLEQAEKLFVVGESRASATLNEIEQCIFSDPNNLFGNTELILFHSAITKQPTNTQAWLAQRHIDGINHVRTNQYEDLNRLARLITNRCNSLVFSGGGARGLAHAGVIKAFEKSGIPIDAIGGASMGSVIAGLYAKNREYGALEEEILKLTEAGTLLDYTLPIVAMTKGKRVTNRLQKAFGRHLKTEDLWMKFFAVATNIVNAHLEVLTKGLLWKNIRASTSLPGIFPPMFLKEFGILVDGAVLNGLPIDVMRKLIPDGCVIATRVTTPKQTAQFQSAGAIISGWEMLWDKLNPWSKKKEFMNIATLLINALTISSAQNESLASNDADINLELDTSNFEMLNLKPAKQIIDLGYESTMRKLEDEETRSRLYK